MTLAAAAGAEALRRPYGICGCAGDRRALILADVPDGAAIPAVAGDSAEAARNAGRAVGGHPRRWRGGGEYGDVDAKQGTVEAAARRRRAPTRILPLQLRRVHGRLRFGDGALRGGLVGGGAVLCGGGCGVMLRHRRRLLRAMRHRGFQIPLLARRFAANPSQSAPSCCHRLREPGVEREPTIDPGGEFTVVRDGARTTSACDAIAAANAGTSYAETKVACVPRSRERMSDWLETLFAIAPFTWSYFASSSAKSGS